MKKEKRLFWARNVFAFVVFVSLGVIVVTEKAKEVLIPKVQEKMEEYIENTYPDLKEEVNLGKITVSNKVYTMKVSSKKNEDWYFYLTHKNNKITDTYSKDYLEGKTLLDSIQKELEKEITKETNTTPSIEIISSLDHFTEAVKERIVLEENLLELPFFKIKKELIITNWTSEEITKKIIDTMNIYEEKGITPKSYTLTITNKNNITESIEIKNLTSSFKDNKDNKTIIQNILDDNNSKLVKENDITYKYLNEED